MYSTLQADAHINDLTAWLVNCYYTHHSTSNVASRVNILTLVDTKKQDSMLQ